MLLPSCDEYFNQDELDSMFENHLDYLAERLFSSKCIIIPYSIPSTVAFHFAPASGEPSADIDLAEHFNKDDPSAAVVFSEFLCQNSGVCGPCGDCSCDDDDKCKCDDRYPHKCNICGKPAYLNGYNLYECSNKQCANYR